MGIISWVVLGALSGWIASMLAGTNGEQGFLGNVVVGIIGALIGGFIFKSLDARQVDGVNLYSIFVATIGAVILLALYKLVS